jgi:hypothetical protein
LYFGSYTFWISRNIEELKKLMNIKSCIVLSFIHFI